MKYLFAFKKNLSHNYLLRGSNGRFRKVLREQNKRKEKLQNIQP